MKSVSRSNWLSIWLVAALTAALGWFARERLLLSTHDRLTQTYLHEIDVLSDRNAADLVARLAQDDAQWLDVLVPATADDRPIVAQAAESALLDLVTHWSVLPAEASSRQAATLAHLLAQQAQNLSADRCHPHRSLAQRLILWPVDGRIVDAAKFISDCQSVLLLPEVEPQEIRVASAAPQKPVEEPVATPPPPSPPDAGPAVAPASPEVTVTLPNEPARFTAPAAIRISDD